MSSMKLTSFTGGEFRITSAQGWKRTIGAGGRWDNGSNKTLPYELLKSPRDIILLRSCKKFSLEIISTVDYVGLNIPDSFNEVKVVYISGTVKNLKFIDQTYSSDIQNSHNDTNAHSLALNDTLNAGDIVSIKDGSRVVIEFTYDREKTYETIALDAFELAK